MIIEVTNRLVINHRSHERINGKPAWCELPYYGKPGCMNYKKCKKLPRLEEYFNLRMQHWFVIETFDMGAHIKKMKSKYPKWSERQCRNILYWQATVRKKLKERCISLMNAKDPTCMIFHLIPEAMGLNVIVTMRRMGREMEIKKPMIIRKIGLVGFKGRGYVNA